MESTVFAGATTTTKPRIIKGGQSLDDRGRVCFCNDFDFSDADIKRMYTVSNHEQGFVRAWHGHEKEGKYVYVPTGAAWFAIKPVPDFNNADPSLDDITQVTLSAENPQVLWIPPGHAHGFMTMELGTVIIFFSTSSLRESMMDDRRFEPSYWDIFTPMINRWR